MLKISACIPVYNVPDHYLASLLDSVVAQDYGDFEIVIGDDDSRIDYSDVVARYQKKAKLRYYRNSTNLGMVGNWNETVGRAWGDLVIILGHDDLIDPGMFRAYADAFEKSSDVVLVCSGSKFVGADGAPVDFRTNVNHRERIFVDRPRYELDGREATRLCLRNGAALGELSVHMFRREDFDLVGQYDPHFRHSADVDLALRIAQRGETVYLNQPYLQRRMHADNLTWQNLANGHVTSDRAELFERNRVKYNFSAEDIARFRAYLVACACYDLLRLPRHKSLKVAVAALGQIGRYGQLRPVVYGSACIEILRGSNKDRR